jgi:DNA invertase Pin-like site-specific DNA recombinase
MKAAIYVRVSTSQKGQDVDNQVLILKEYCEKMNYEITEIYSDEISGGTADRPAFKKMFADAAKRKFDLLLFWSLDRFSREGTRATIHYLEQLESAGVNFKSYSEQYIDSCGIFKDVVISLLSTLAKQEKLRISERVKAGLNRSKKKGGRPKKEDTYIVKMGELQKTGISIREIARRLQISHSTVSKYMST